MLRPRRRMDYLIHEAILSARVAFNVFRLFGGHRRDTQKEVLTKIAKAMIPERVHPSQDSPQTRDQKEKNYNRLEALRQLFKIPHAREAYDRVGLLPLMNICRDLNYRRLEDAFPSILEISAFFEAQGLVQIEPELVLCTLFPSDQRTAEEREFANSLTVYKARQEAEAEAACVTGEIDWAKSNARLAESLKISDPGSSGPMWDNNPDYASDMRKFGIDNAGNDSGCCMEEPGIAEITRKRPPSPLIPAERRELQKRKRSSKQASSKSSSRYIERGWGKAMGHSGDDGEQREKGEGQEDLGEEMTRVGRAQRHGEKQLEGNEIDKMTKGRERGQTVGERGESGGGGGQPDVGGEVPSETIGEQEDPGERRQRQGAETSKPSGAGGSFALNEQGRMAQPGAESGGVVTEENADCGVKKAVKYALKGIQEDSSTCLDRINLLVTGIEEQNKEIEVKNGQIASLKKILAQLDMEVKTLTELKQENVKEEKVQRDQHAQLYEFSKALEALL